MPSPDLFSPIQLIVPIGDNGQPISGLSFYVKTPTKYEWALEDISDTDSGRTEDLEMNKKRIGQVIKLSISWSYPTLEEASTILQAFNYEYINVTYLDALAGDFIEKQFYVGNRKTPLFNSKMGRWESISFDIIERTANIRTM